MRYITADSVKDMIAGGNGSSVEIRSALPSEDAGYARTLVAFSNSSGGYIVFGAESGGRVTGVPDDVLFSEMDAIRKVGLTQCEPPIDPYVGHRLVDDKGVILVTVLAGISAPYRVADEGRRGILVRSADTNAVASDGMVHSLKLRGVRARFDLERCDAVTVDADSVESLCRRLSSESRAVTTEMLSDVGILCRDGPGYSASNAYALLTSNPFAHARIRCVCPGSPDEAVAFRGDVLSQVDGAADFVAARAAWIPRRALWEAVTNAVIHRDYSLPDREVRIRVYDGMVEVESPGFCNTDASGCDWGLSKPRNTMLAWAFHAAGYLSAYGHGIPDMFSDCEACGCPAPELAEADESFKVVLRCPA